MKFASAVLLLGAGLVQAHDYLTYPRPRVPGNAQPTTTTPCEDTTVSTTRQIFASGEPIPVFWDCNHCGVSSSVVKLSIVASSGTPSEVEFEAAELPAVDYNSGKFILDPVPDGDYIIRMEWGQYKSCADVTVAADPRLADCTLVGCAGEQTCNPSTKLCEVEDGAVPDEKFGTCVACGSNKVCRFEYDDDDVTTEGLPCMNCYQCRCAEGYQEEPKEDENGNDIENRYTCKKNKCDEDCPGESYCKENGQTGAKYCGCGDDPNINIATGPKCDRYMCTKQNGAYSCNLGTNYDNNNAYCTTYTQEGVSPFCTCKIGFARSYDPQYTDINCRNDITDEIAENDEANTNVYCKCPSKTQACTNSYECLCKYGYKNVTTVDDPDGSCVAITGDEKDDLPIKVNFKMWVSLDDTLAPTSANRTEHAFSKDLMVDVWHIEVLSGPKDASKHDYCFTSREDNTGQESTTDIACYQYEIEFYGSELVDARLMYKYVLGQASNRVSVAGHDIIALESKYGNYNSAASIAVNAFLVVALSAFALFF